jgi:prenyltransferase beta subunit
MSIRLEMIQVARLAPEILGDAADLVRAFLQKQLHGEGGFIDRQGNQDLYYTVFGLDGLQSLDALPEPSRWQPFLESKGAGEGADFVHLCCLIRCLSIAPEIKGSKDEMLKKLMEYRCPDGGFQPEIGAEHGTAYGAFLAVGALQDLGLKLDEFQHGIMESLNKLRTSDGGWGNDTKQRSGATNATAAAMTTMRQFGMTPGPEAAQWLVSNSHPMGGFLANKLAPIPDLLSTATALHALSGVQYEISEELRERSLDYIDTLWTNEGSFHGHWHEDELDTEYTFYGLLALGHLSV